MKSSAELIHPAIIRPCHWLNALATLVMVTNGWAIYNASPLYRFEFYDDLTLGGWLGGALLWHFTAMWLVIGNGLIYLTYSVASGRFARKLLPLSPLAVGRDLAAVIAGRLNHHDPAQYNAIQKAAYLGAIGLLMLMVVSGLALWKPFQFWRLSMLFGGYELTRHVHFWAMTGICLFLVLHLVMTLLVPKTLLAMLRGRV